MEAIGLLKVLCNIWCKYLNIYFVHLLQRLITVLLLWSAHHCVVSLCALLPMTAQPLYKCIYHQMMPYLILLVTTFFLACCVLLYSAVMRWEYTYRLGIVLNLDFQGQYQHQLGAYYSYLMCFAYFLSYRPLENCFPCSFYWKEYIGFLIIVISTHLLTFLFEMKAHSRVL